MDFNNLEIGDIANYRISGGKPITGIVTKVANKTVTISDIYKFKKIDGKLIGDEYGIITYIGKPINNVESLISDSEVLNIYIFGSHLYGTATDTSDIDYIVIVKDDFWFDGENIKVGKNDFNFYSESNWLNKCNSAHINAIEVMSITDPKFILKETQKFIVSKSLIKLRQSISAVVSNSWSKANKKLSVDKDFDPFIAKKSLWHCFRMLDYGIQVCKYGIVTDFSSMNYLYNEIINNESNDWKIYKQKYQEPLNNMRTKFRLFMEKEWIEFKKETENE